MTSKHTFNSILTMIYNLDAYDRRDSYFTSDDDTFMDLRLLHDDNGNFLISSPMNVDDHPRLLGFVVYVDDKYDGLSFGPKGKL